VQDQRGEGEELGNQIAGRLLIHIRSPSQDSIDPLGFALSIPKTVIKLKPDQILLAGQSIAKQFPLYGHYCVVKRYTENANSWLDY